jgi:hypothetical protein
MRFKNFLTEAKVTERNFSKAVDIFKRLLERHLSLKLHRYAGPNGFVEIRGGMGILYIAKNKKAYRFNYGKGAIHSISVWDSYALGKKADKTITLDGLGLAQSGMKLIKIIKDAKTGSFDMYPVLLESVDDSAQDLTEGSKKRVSPQEWFDLISKNKTLYGSGETFDAIRFETATIIAENEGVLIPSIFRKAKVAGTKGVNARYSVSIMMDLAKNPGKTVSVKDSIPMHTVTVSNGDNITSTGVSPGTAAKAEALSNQANQAITAPSNNQLDLMGKDPDALFGIMSSLVKVVSRGNRNSLIIYGGPGTGKTYTVTQTLAAEGLAKNKDWFVVKGKITTAALYQTLFMHRQGALLVFDDTDSVWKDAEAANVLKAALDSYDERTVSWLSARTTNVSKMDDFEKEIYNDDIDQKLNDNPANANSIKLPSEFAYNGRIIFISNLAESKFDSAVLTRSAKIDMTLTDGEMFYRMQSVLPHLGDSNIPLDVKQTILEFVKERLVSGVLKNVSMRTYVAAEDLYKTGLDNWKDMLEHM